MADPRLLLLVVTIAAFVAFAVWYLRSTRVRAVPSSLVRGAPDQVTRDLVVALSGSPQTTVHSIDDRTLWVEHRQVPAWAVFVSVLALPFSLIALLVRSTVSGALVVDAVSETESYVRVSGVFHPAALRSLHQFLDARGVDRRSGSGTPAGGSRPLG